MPVLPFPSRRSLLFGGGGALSPLSAAVAGVKLGRFSPVLVLECVALSPRPGVTRGSTLLVVGRFPFGAGALSIEAG